MDFLLKAFEPHQQKNSQDARLATQQEERTNESHEGDYEDEKSVASAWPIPHTPCATNPVEKKIYRLKEQYAPQDSLNLFVSKIIVEFLETFAREYGLHPKNLNFSFAAALPRIIDQQQSKKIALGDIARKIHAYSVLATQVMKNRDAQDTDNFTRVKSLCELLDQELPIKCRSSEDTLHVKGPERELNATKLSARCAIPYAFGYDTILPRNKLHFLAQSLVNGQDKQMAVALQYLTESAADVYKLTEKVSKQQLVDIISSIPAPVDLLQGLKYHQESGLENSYLPNVEKTSVSKSIRERVQNCEAVLPPSLGSILRVYIRQHFDDSYDDKETDIQHMKACIPK